MERVNGKDMDMGYEMNYSVENADIVEPEKVHEPYMDDVEAEIDEMITSDDDLGVDDDSDNDSDDSDIIEEADSGSSFKLVNEHSRILTTAEYNQLNSDVQSKMKELDEARVHLEDARAEGDLRENSAFETWSDNVRRIEQDIAQMTQILNSCTINDNVNTDKEIGKGSRVRLYIVDKNGDREATDVVVTIVSEGFGGISESGEVMMPENSDIYRHMAGMISGSFDTTGTDGVNYHYDFEILRG